MKKYAGVMAATVSAFLFGATPVLVRLAYNGGANGITVTFFRALFAIPALLGILLVKKIPLGINFQQARSLLLTGAFGSALTPLLLYSSYQYIPVSLATLLHFFFPVLVTLTSVLLFKVKINKWMILALILGSAGVLLFLEQAFGSFWGYVLALGSSVSYTVYMLGVERSCLKEMNPFKISLYFCVIQAAMTFLFGGISGTLTFALAPRAWVYIFIVSMLVSVGALTLFQLGILLAGAPTTALLSTLEPITSVVCGILVLGETVTGVKIAGCLCILAGVLLTAVSKLRAQPAG